VLFASSPFIRLAPSRSFDLEIAGAPLLGIGELGVLLRRTFERFAPTGKEMCDG
jgi:hypothetical protein